MADWSILGTSSLTVAAAQSPFAVPTFSFTELILLASAGVGNLIVNLPPAVGSQKKVTVKKMDGNATYVNVTPNGTDTIDGLNEALSITQQYATITVFDGALGAWTIF